MARRWDYSDCRAGSHGLMKCCACGKDIGAGRYRVRESKSGSAYVTQHEACSKEDPAWVEWDRRNEASNARLLALSDACREFRKTWGVTELDDYIIADATKLEADHV